MTVPLTDAALAYLLESAGLTLTEAEKSDLLSIHEGLAAMKAQVQTGACSSFAAISIQLHFFFLIARILRPSAVLASFTCISRHAREERGYSPKGQARGYRRSARHSIESRQRGRCNHRAMPVQGKRPDAPRLDRKGGGDVSRRAP